MVNVYITNVSNLPDPLINPDIMTDLSAERKQKILKYRQEKDRKQSLGAGLLLLKVLNEFGKDMNDIYYGENGKPEIEGICFNISHSHDMVVCAVSDRVVGVDIEKIGEIKGNIAKRFFTERENQYLEQFEGQERIEQFFRLWTMKESYMKYTGEGMRLALDRFEFHFDEEVTVYRDGLKDICNIKEYVIPGYKLTVCAMEKEFAQEIKVVHCR